LLYQFVMAKCHVQPTPRGGWYLSALPSVALSPSRAGWSRRSGFTVLLPGARFFARSPCGSRRHGRLLEGFVFRVPLPYPLPPEASPGSRLAGSAKLSKTYILAFLSYPSLVYCNTTTSRFSCLARAASNGPSKRRKPLPRNTLQLF
jgi:hypothetical protein